MQVGDLCRIASKSSISGEYQLGDYIILIRPCLYWKTRKFKMWETIDIKTGSIYHLWESDLEVIL